MLKITFNKKVFNMNMTPAYVVDGIKSIAIHNGVARVLFVRLDADGEPLAAVELDIPLNQLEAITTAIGNI